MTMTQINEPTFRKPLRLWPGVVLAIGLLLARYVVPPLASDIERELFGMPLAIVSVFAGMFCAAAIVVWWLLFSRARWLERVGAIALFALGLFVTSRVVHVSITGGMMGAMLYVYSIPILALALVVWAVATSRLPDGARRALLVATVVLACVPWTLIRTAGTFGAGSELHWRWTPTPEQKLLAQGSDDPRPPVGSASTPTPQPVPAPPEPAKEPVTPTKEPAAPAAAPAARPTTGAAATAPADPAPKKSAEWPGFRGPNRDAIVRGVRIKTDWSATPPKEMWRRPIGPGWSSFAVDGDLIYTQEQRGDDEIVASYKLSTGQPVWRHRDPVRFWESNAGPGPRGTPTLDNGRVYAFGATGILNALDARTGKVIWSRNVSSDTGRRIPDWGFSSSPLIVDDMVIVAAAGTLAAYDIATGNPRWRGPSYGGSYSSPHRATLDGVTQIVLLGGPGAISVAPATGAVLWEHKWMPGAIVQPAMTADGDILVNALVSTGGVGTRRLAVSHESGEWKVAERWTSNGLKPYFNDFVVHKGHAYGFDGSILACIDLETGQRKWKGGRYGSGQLVLLADQDALLVISEEGELALVGATPDQFSELARFKAIEGKTWNHPALVRDVLLVRNGEEMAAFRLTRAN
jgi:outer membrane protein assembly factor BamB